VCRVCGRGGKEGWAAPADRHRAGGHRAGGRVRDRGAEALVSRRTQLILFVVGAAVFGWLVSQIGMNQLWSDAKRTGWMAVPIIFLFAVVYLFNAAAWHVMMIDEPSRPPFWQTYAITVSGFSINFLTPMMNMGGEPFKI